MPPVKLDPSILLALGLASTGCGDKDTDSSTTAQPCLDYATETQPCLTQTQDTGEKSDTGEKADTGPCLDFPADTGLDTGEPPDTGANARGQQRQDPTDRVLRRGVLPDDVAKLLRKQQKSESH